MELGSVLTELFEVRHEHTAKHVGSGEVEVLSTPSMISFIERTALNCVKPFLKKGEITVGTKIDITHINPVPVGATLRVTVQLSQKEGRRLVFTVKVEWKNEIIGYGKHERFIVSRQKFLTKLKGK